MTSLRAVPTIVAVTTIAAVAAVAMVCLAAVPAGAEAKIIRGHTKHGSARFSFNTYGERLWVEETGADDTAQDGALVEIWFKGKLRRTCWDFVESPEATMCNFSIKNGTKLWIYVARAWPDTCRAFRPSRGCRKGEWTGPFKVTA
jgi:hypothetical protein